MHRRQEVDRFVVPVGMLVEVMLVVHYNMAHVGRQKLIELVGQHVWHPTMRAVAEDITSTCDSCQRFKVSSIVAPPMLKIQTSRPFQLLAVDLVALPKCGPYVGCLAAIDHFTKWLCVVPITCKTGAHVAKQFEHRVLPSCAVPPETVLSDNGGEFKSAEFNDVLNKYNCGHTYTTAYKPSSNGLVERVNRTVLELLRIDEYNNDKWMDLLPKVIMIYNVTYQTTLKCSPSEKILRQAHDGRDPLLIPADTVDLWREGSSSFQSYKTGEEVMKKVVRKGNEVIEKFRPRFDGPYTVEVVNPNGITYQIKHLQSGLLIKAHHAQLRRYKRPPNYLNEHPFFVGGDSKSKQHEYQCEPDEAHNTPMILCSAQMAKNDSSDSSGEDEKSTTSVGSSDNTDEHENGSSSDYYDTESEYDSEYDSEHYDTDYSLSLIHI